MDDKRIIMADKRIPLLIAKHLMRTLTGPEKQELDTWINVSPFNREFMETRMHPAHVLETMKLLSRVDDERIFRNFRRRAGLRGR